MSIRYHHISTAAQDAIAYIDGRRKGTITSLRTSSPKLNRALLGGIEWGKVFAIGGLSGAGKSLITEQMKRDFVDLNPEQDFEILSFEFEMLAKDNVIRSISGKTERSVKDLLSAETPLTEDEYATVKNAASKISNYPIFYIDDSCSVPEIEASIYTFVDERQLVQKDKGLIITIDHVLLTKGRQGESEKAVVDSLCKMAIRVKKKLSSVMNILIILVTQLNRDIESKERKMNTKLHYPNKTDIFGASSIFFASDYVMISHVPANIDGIGSEYGPAYLPLYNPENPSQKMVYWHIIKDRTGKPRILKMLDEFQYSRVVEYHPPSTEENLET